MGRRRSKSDRRRKRGAATPAQQAGAASGGGSTEATAVSPSGAAGPTATDTAERASQTTAQPAAQTTSQPQSLSRSTDRSALRPWRTRVQDLLDHLHSWSRANYGPALEDFLTQRFGSAQATEAAPGEDVDRAVEDYVCASGSAGDARSILSVFAEQAPGTGGGPMDPEDRVQVQRWERERSRGVFLIQHAARDRLTLWDPLEGAPLTLHLLRKLGQARAEGLRRGTIVTATYQPWMARLVAIGTVEFFDDERAITLFRAETLESGASWHEAPPAAPQPTQRTRG